MSGFNPQCSLALVDKVSISDLGSSNHVAVHSLSTFSSPATAHCSSSSTDGNRPPTHLQNCQASYHEFPTTGKSARFFKRNTSEAAKPTSLLSRSIPAVGTV